MLLRLCSKFFKLAFSSMWIENFQMYKLGFKDSKESEIKLPIFTGSWGKQENSRRNIYFFFINYAKIFDCVDHNKLWKILKEMEVPDHLTCLLRNLYVGQEVTEPDMKQLTGSQLGTEYNKAVYHHPPYLTSMQNTSCETPGWMNHKLESRLRGAISTTSDMQMIPL